MLCNTLALVKPLKAFEDQANQVKKDIGKKISHDECSTLVTSAEINHDTQFQLKSSKLSKKVYCDE